MVQIVGLIFQALIWLVSAYTVLIVIWALLSWLPGGYQSKFGQIVGRLVLPFLQYFDFISVGPIGLGPIAAIIVLSIVQNGLRFLAQIVITHM
ncbi:YggT family protein [Levilactobacillus tangyuanensis]|uniref:YggT family protein n=1 Tax=Levilactobacillus tangyuanensis TaxID=2486021 RepID=A0ABW1TLA0_9LACO|nr:YggT family protein [Levilactobacillus tangyuanensis]